MTDAVREDGLLPAWQSSQMQARFGASITSKAMTVATTMLLDCVRLRYASVPIPPQATIATRMTELEEIQQIMNEAVSRQWNEVSIAVQQHLSCNATREVMARYVQAWYWLMIKEEVKTLNGADLPTPRGRLTEFSRAENAAAESFMAWFSYGTSRKSQARFAGVGRGCMRCVRQASRSDSSIAMRP